MRLTKFVCGIFFIFAFVFFCVLLFILAHMDILLPYYYTKKSLKVLSGGLFRYVQNVHYFSKKKMSKVYYMTFF